MAGMAAVIDFGKTNLRLLVIHGRAGYVEQWLHLARGGNGRAHTPIKPETTLA